MLRVALTGNIASGKSAVSAVWERLGATIVDADELAREAVAPGSAGLARVVERFGAEMLAADGTLDRAALRARVFADDRERRDLEAILHPEIERLRRRADAEAEARGERLVVHVVPLLFETGLDERFDRVVLVDAPEAVRLDRLVRDRGLDPAEARGMIEAQMPAAKKRDRADLVIDNTGTLDELEAAAAAAWTRVRAWAEPAP